MDHMCQLPQHDARVVPTDVRFETCDATDTAPALRQEQSIAAAPTAAPTPVPTTVAIASPAP